MLRVEIPINLTFSFQIEPLSCFATVKNQIYTPTKLLLSFGCQGQRVEVESWGGRVKEEKKEKKKKRKGSKLNYQRFFPENGCVLWSCCYLQASNYTRFPELKVEAAVCSLCKLLSVTNVLRRVG